jgi:hypothetical protein
MSGSYMRFVIGLILSLTVLWSFFTAEKTSFLSFGLALIFVILSVIWFAFRF